MASFDFARRRVLLIGDLIIDVHHFGAGQGISIEAPVPVGRELETRTSLGGAGLVARNLEALGARTTFAFVAGPDFLKQVPVLFRGQSMRKKIFFESGRVVTVKERFIINGEKMLRWNVEASKSLSAVVERQIVSWFKWEAGKFDVVLISDYRHGLMTKRLANALIKEAHRRRLPVYVDSQITRGVSNYAWYRGATLFCLNEKEALEADVAFNAKYLERSLARLVGKLGVSAVVVKLGAKGSVALADGQFIQLSAYRVKAVDAVGAGDAFLAALAAGGVVSDRYGELSSQTLDFANLWAGIATTLRGTEPPSLKLLKKYFNQHGRIRH